MRQKSMGGIRGRNSRRTYGYNCGDNRLDDSCDGRDNGINAAADGRYDGALKKDAAVQRRYM